MRNAAAPLSARLAARALTAGILAGCDTGVEFSPHEQRSGMAIETSYDSVPPTTGKNTPFIAESRVRTIDPAFAARMGGVTLRDYPGCATVDQLRIVDVPYHDLNGENAMGSLVVRKGLAQEVGDIFEEVY